MTMNNLFKVQRNYVEGHLHYIVSEVLRKEIVKISRNSFLFKN